MFGSGVVVLGCLNGTQGIVDAIDVTVYGGFNTGSVQIEGIETAGVANSLPSSL